MPEPILTPGTPLRERQVLAYQRVAKRAEACRSIGEVARTVVEKAAAKRAEREAKE